MGFENMAKLSWIYDLYRLGQSAELRDDPAKAQREILEHIVKGMGAATGSLTLSDEADGDLILRAGIGIPDHVIGKRMPRGEGVIGWVATHGEPVLLNEEVRNDPRFKGKGERKESAVPTSSICWPLRQDAKVIGTLCVNRAPGQPSFSDADVEHGKVMVNLITIVIENARLHMQQQERIDSLFELNLQLSEMNRRLEEAQSQLLQSEKMASIGQLAAGVAHEINNPIGYVYSNLGSLEKYLKDIFDIVSAYEDAESAMEGQPVLASIQALKEQLDLAFLKEDAFSLMAESKEGITRVKKIVQDLKDFSHVDASEEWVWADLHKGIDSTLNIVWNELKYKAEVVKEYGPLPEIHCLPSQLNQVFMNMLVNAGHAIEERGTITIRSGVEDNMVWVEIADSGKGIPAEHLKRIFDPFFTTKPVGKGTGLGLSLSYSIIQKHHGRIEVHSTVGEGTRFRVWLPIEEPARAAA